MKREFIDSVRQDLQTYAGCADANARKIERYCTDLAIEIEELNKNLTKDKVSIEKMDADYSLSKDDFGNELFIKTDSVGNGQMTCLASGCQRVPLTAETKRQLKLYESLKPTFLHMYDELEYVDEIWLFETKSNVALGRIENDFANHIIPGLDGTLLYDYGLTFYDWFKFVDKQNNPNRKALWSPMAFIEMYHQLIMHLKAPVYENRYSDKEEMIGITTAHLNLDWLMADTIEKSAVKMMIVKDDSTLIGMNSPAKKDIQLETHDPNNYSNANPLDPELMQKKKRFVYETLNLEHEKADEISSFAKKVKSEFQFSHYLFGKSYTIVREKAPEMGFNFVALLDNVE